MTTAPEGAAPEEIKSDLNAADDIEPSEASQLIDRYGHPHSESIFRNWTPAAIRALGIRRVGAP